MAHDLEAPGSDEAPEWASLYRARGEEVVEHRPVFTGDVFWDVTIAGEANPKSVIILQHPCAIRVDGVTLMPRLLVAEVAPAQVLMPSKWVTGNYKTLPLVGLRPGELPETYAAKFIEHHLVARAELGAGTRIACLSQRGVNLLMQRWVHHNSRVIVPTWMYQEVSAPQFEEADMIEDWCTDRADDGIDAEAATPEVDAWLSEKLDGESRRDRLKDEQSRAQLRRDLREHLKAVRQSTATSPSLTDDQS